jgi:hypothetical protein
MLKSCPWIRITLLFDEYTTLNQHLEFMEVDADKTMGQSDLTSSVYILPQNQNPCIHSTQFCILVLRVGWRSKIVANVCDWQLEWSYYTEAKAEISCKFLGMKLMFICQCYSCHYLQISTDLHCELCICHAHLYQRNLTLLNSFKTSAWSSSDNFRCTVCNKINSWILKHINMF